MEVFDAVVVAVGQNTQPRLPTIKGTACMDKWNRRQLHSHSYPKIDFLCKDGQVVFADGSAIVADAIIYCTRYDFSFPFLDTAGHVTVDDNHVGPLYEHTFPPALAPSLSFVGLPKLVAVWRFFEAQAPWVAQVLSGRRSLPPPEEMTRSVEDYNRAREAAGVPKRHTHNIAFDWEYCNEFGDKHCGFPRLDKWKKELLLSSVRSWLERAEGCRDDYFDSDLILEGLRSQGWLAGRRAPQGKAGRRRRRKGKKGMFGKGGNHWK